MTSAKKSVAQRRKKSLLTKPASPTMQDVWARTQMLVEVLLSVMEREIRARKSEPSERWLKLFGTKDSAVVNLQKLVLLLGELQAQSPQKIQAHEVAPVDAQELAILADWLKSVNAVNVLPAAE